MTTRKSQDKNIRNLTKSGKHSLYVMLPIEITRKLKWKERQKVVVKLSGKKIIIEDWEK
jgi:hypothetical protein